MNETEKKDEKKFRGKKAFYFVRTRGHDYSNYARAKGIVELISLDFTECLLFDFGVEYFGHSLSKNKVISFFQLAFSHLLNKNRVKKYIKNSSETPDIIFSTFMAKNTMNYLKKYCLRKKILLVCDYTEWNTAEEKRLGLFSPSLRSCQFAITKWMSFPLNAIGISTYFINYFTNKGINCVRLPNMLDCSKLKFEGNSSSKDRSLDLLFVGNKHRLDFVNVLIDAMAMLVPEELANVHATIIGSDVTRSSKSPINFRNLEKIQSHLTIFDRQPYSVFEKLYAKCDFSVFILSSKLLYAKALFPTKMTDAFAHSRPVIANLETDLSLYLVDGGNSLICKDDSAEALCDAIRRGLKLSRDEKQQMSLNAFNTVCQEFDYHHYRESFVAFLNAAFMNQGVK